MDPHWKKMDPNLNTHHDHFFKIYWIIITKQNCQIMFLLLFACFMLKLDKPFRNQEIFIISIFFNSSDLGFDSKFFFYSFWLIFCPLDPDLWIRIFLRIRIQEAKILRIQRIRILSTALNVKKVPWNYSPLKWLSYWGEKGRKIEESCNLWIQFCLSLKFEWFG